MESEPQHGNEAKPKDRLVILLDQIERHVEQLRKDASRLEEEKDTLLTTLDTLRNNDMLHALEEREWKRLNFCLRYFSIWSIINYEALEFLDTDDFNVHNHSYLNNCLLLRIADRDDILRYAERLSMRCSTVDVLVTVQRDHIQEEALHQVCKSLWIHWMNCDHLCYTYCFVLSRSMAWSTVWLWVCAKTQAALDRDAPSSWTRALPMEWDIPTKSLKLLFSDAH